MPYKDPAKRREYQRRYAIKNRAAIRARRAPKLKEYRQRFYSKHRERVLEKCAAYRKANKERIKEYFKRHRAANADVYRLYDAIRYRADPSRREGNRLRNKEQMQRRIKNMPDGFVRAEFKRRGWVVEVPAVLFDVFRARLTIKRHLRKSQETKRK